MMGTENLINIVIASNSESVLHSKSAHFRFYQNFDFGIKMVRTIILHNKNPNSIFQFFQGFFVKIQRLTTQYIFQTSG